MNFRDVWTVTKKELKAGFSDKMVLFQIVFMPFLIIAGYALLMGVMSSAAIDSGDEEVRAYYVNAPEYMEEGLQALQLEPVSSDRIDELKTDIENKDCELLVVFPEDFALSDGTSMDLSNIEVWYNSTDTQSYMMFSEVNMFFSAIQPKLFAVNGVQDVDYDMGDEDAFMRDMLAGLMPAILLMAVYMVVMNLAAESIAGDKERGFLNTMLIAPVKRASIAGGKALFMLIVSIIGGLSAFLGLAVSLPKLGEIMELEANFSYGIKDYVLLFAVTITAVFAISSILLILSTIAKDVKQATTWSPIVMMILLIGGMLSTTEAFKPMIDDLGMINNVIPAWNSMIQMQYIIKCEYTMAPILISCVINLVFSAIAVVLIGKFFESEKILNG